MRSVARRSWAAVAIALGVGIGLLLPNLPGGASTSYRVVAPVGIALLSVVCFRALARTDRLAFWSVVGPAMVIALAALVVPYRYVAWVSLLALGFFAVFIFRGDVAWPWWWRHVLRRQLPTPVSTFNYHLAVEVRAWAEAFRAAADRPDLDDPTEARLALARLRTLEAPDEDWAALRDAYADLGERWLGLIADEARRDEGAELREAMGALEARRKELRSRT